MFDCVIVMAGIGQRAKLGYNKVLYKLDDVPIYMISLGKFNRLEECERIVLVCNKNDYDEVLRETKDYSKVSVVIGGARRQDSVLIGLRECKNENCLIHDGARPFVEEEDILKVAQALDGNNVVVLGSKVTNTIKDMQNKATLNRENLISVSTPQGVKRTLEIKALEKNSQIEFRDDAEVFEKEYECFPAIILASNENEKITNPSDLPTVYRVGYGLDIHRFTTGGGFTLGGVWIDADVKTVAHSDGDVVIHSLMNAIYGAIGSSDIGEHFPDNDPRFKGIDSRVLLKMCLDEMTSKGYKIENIDINIILERPKLKEYKELIKNSLSSLCDTENISVKANTAEGVGELGKGEACEVISLVLVRKVC